MIQMEQPPCWPLTTDPALVDFLNCYGCSAHPAMAGRHYSWKAIQFHNVTPTENLFPNSHLPFSGQLNKESTPAFHREQKRPQPEPLAVLPSAWDLAFLPDCHWFCSSCEIQLEEIKTSWAQIQVRASIPLTQVTKWNSWLNYMTTDGFTAPSPDLSQIVSEPESSEGIILSHAQTASTWNKTALSWISSPPEQIKMWPQCFFHEMFCKSHGHQ